MMLTESARARLRRIQQEYHPHPRLFIHDRRCHFDVADPRDDDVVIDELLRIDPRSARVLEDAVVDCVVGLDGIYFKVETRHRRTTCDCGRCLDM